MEAQIFHHAKFNLLIIYIYPLKEPKPFKILELYN